MAANPSGRSPSWFRGFIQGKTRITLAWLFVVLLAFSVHRFPAWPGIVLCFLGASLRFWASGHLRKDSHPAVGGPYAFVRNPLYLGTYLMALGATWAVENWVFLSALTVLYAMIYHYIILDEEIKLRELFGGPYAEYCRQVPRFFPRLWPPLAPASKKDLLKVNPEKHQLPFSWSLAMKNKAYEAFLSFFGLILFLMSVAFLRKVL